MTSSTRKDEFKQLYLLCRGNYKDKLKSVIMFHNKEKQKTKWMLHHWKLGTTLLLSKRPPNINNMKWIQCLFKENRIDIVNFLTWFTLIADKKIYKINTLVLQGPTGTGKSLTLNALIGQLNTGIVTRTGDANQFHLQNLLGKSYGLFEEPRISQITIDDFKLLFEGACFEINVEHQEPEMLTRITIFVSTKISTTGYHHQAVMPSTQRQKHSSSGNL